MKSAIIAPAILALVGLGQALPSERSLEERVFQPGWCGAHIDKVVHDCDHSNPDCDSLYGFVWAVNITVFDDRQRRVGHKFVDPVIAFDVQTITVPSTLKKDLVYKVVQGAHPDIIAYGASIGNVVHPQCAVGGNDTFVSTNCGFPCEII